MKIRLPILFCLFILASCQSDPVPNNNESSASTPSSQKSKLETTLPEEHRDYTDARYRWGFMNKSGQLIIQDNFDEARNFSEGLALVRKKGKWGYINKFGSVVIRPQFKSAWSFEGEYARVKTFEQKMGFIDQKGNWFIEPEFELVKDFSEGLARVQVY